MPIEGRWVDRVVGLDGVRQNRHTAARIFARW
jgi:hypothetical protein